MRNDKYCREWEEAKSYFQSVLSPGLSDFKTEARNGLDWNAIYCTMEYASFALLIFLIPP